MLIPPFAFWGPVTKKIVRYFNPVGVQDPEVNKLARYKATRSGRKGSNAARDFHRYVHRSGKAFPVEISTRKIIIRKKVTVSGGKKRKREKVADYPIIRMSSWMKAILERHPDFMLGGHSPFVNGGENYKKMFEEFWDNYEYLGGDHPVFHLKSREERTRCIPLMLHGDEGRGLAKVPLLVISFQLMIPFSGPNDLNCSKHSFTTRLLFSLMPSDWYAKKDASVNGLLQALADDLTELFHEGVTISVDGEPCTFYGIYVACKGDWPWVRKAYGLSTGFASRRKCHYCPGQDSSLECNNLWFEF
ncbi:unnamed protein product [Cladocopium goreaui]|uniref:Uncharacterized protein n=1 Tax=Cladocopium goreaui TaxID=2562237 RepID=A0A9P1D134_9DINO|nr:unnamed protein product [Cladocopium goreaui]